MPAYTTHRRSRWNQAEHEKSIDKAESRARHETPTAYTEAPIGRSTINGECWTLPTCFCFKDMLGSGAYGSVARFYDSSRNCCVAVKRIGDVFRDSLDAKRILRELKVLRHLRGRANIVNVLDILAPSSPDFDEIYIVLECLETDLHKYMHNEFIRCSQTLRSTIFQLLRAFLIVHKAGILHRDVKPSNVLIQHDATYKGKDVTVKLCDFGLARQRIEPVSTVTSKERSEKHNYFSLAYPPDPCRCPTASTVAPSDPSSPTLSPVLDSAEPPAMSIDHSCGLLTCADQQLTEYVVTRWYRAPEILVNTGDYDQGVDIWGVGCVIAEMVRKSPLFTGWDNEDQITKICRALGKPTDVDSLYKSPGRKLSIEALRTRHTLETLPPYPGGDLSTLLPGADPLLVDLLRKMLVVNPDLRCTAEQALQHPYFQDYLPWHPIAKDIEALGIMDWEFDNVPLIKRSVQTKIYEEIITHWHPEIILRDISKIIHFDIKLPNHLMMQATNKRKALSRSRSKRRRHSYTHNEENVEVKRGGFLIKVARCISQRLYSSASSSIASEDLECHADRSGGDYVIPINN